jgi:hypothetical protein
MPDDRLAILEQRRIEAAVIKPIYEEMKNRFGETAAQEVLRDAITKSAIEAGKEFAAEADGKTDLKAFQGIIKHWLKGDALEKEDLKQTDEEFEFNVTRCRYSEMYRDMGIGDIGHLLSCHRDATFCQGFDPRITFERTQTLMEGASHCDFRYGFDVKKEN